MNTPRPCWQFCQDGYDITGQIHAEHDADEARAWDDDLCMIAVQRDGADPPRWRITSSDNPLPDDAEHQVFNSPHDALNYLTARTDLLADDTAAEDTDGF